MSVLPHDGAFRLTLFRTLTVEVTRLAETLSRALRARQAAHARESLGYDTLKDIGFRSVNDDA